MKAPDRDALVRRLRSAGCVYAEDEAALLIAEARNDDDLERLVAARIAGQPLETVLGWVSFRGLRIHVEAGVFVPRRRTEFVVEQAIARAPHVLLDLCCGCGAIAAAVRAALPHAEVHAADVDPAAVRCAGANLPVGTVHLGDLYAALPDTLRSRIDVIAVNAPYVPTPAIATMPAEAREHEPLIALDGGPDGVDVHRRIAVGAREWLAGDGCVIVETSSVQAERTRAAFRAEGFRAGVAHSADLESIIVVADVVSP